jgi:hypothetical protein
MPFYKKQRVNVTDLGRRFQLFHSAQEHIWTHPVSQGCFSIEANKEQIAYIYPACEWKSD